LTIPNRVIALENGECRFAALAKCHSPGAVTNIGGDAFYIDFARAGGAGDAITSGPAPSAPACA